LTQWILDQYRVSCVRACRLGGISRAGWYKRSKAKDQTALRLRIREIAMNRPRFGYERIHGTEFTSKALDQWAWENGVQLDFTKPGKPTDNGLCESFNGRLRDECLNVNEFTSIDEAKQRIEAWRIDYNQHRPHGALGYLTPSEFANAGQKQPIEAADF
jgi:transposase InsO family protein